MSGDATVRHRDKRVSRPMAAVLAAPSLFTLLMAVLVGVSNSTADRPVPAAALPFVLAGMVALAVMFAFLAVAFAVLRTVVTNRDVIVKYGLWGPRIPLGAITSCKVVPYEWRKFGGWGIRHGLGGVKAYVASDGDVVEIAYTEEGKEQRVQVGADDPYKLMTEIEAARRALERVRLGADAPAAAEAGDSAADEDAEAPRAEHRS